MQHASNPPRGSAFRYLDFELEIQPGTGRDYPVRVINSPEGQARATMHFPFDEPALELHLGDLRAALRSVRRWLSAARGAITIGVVILASGVVCQCGIAPAATPTPARTPRALTATPTPTLTPAPTRAPTPTPTGEPTGPLPGATKELGQTGITLVYVPAGEFLMGSTDGDPDAESSEKPQHLVYLDGYWIGKTEVTNAQYRKFVEDGGYSKAEYWSEEGWQWKESNTITEPAYWADPAWNGADYPVVGVSLYEASAYARWAGARLPTEAEWEKAARGTDGRVYPWGNEWDDSRVNASGASTSPVGHYSPGGDSPYGVADMAGNVWEWTLSLWGEDWREPEFKYPYDATDGRENVKAGEWVLRVVRGGSFNDGRSLARCSYRSWWLPGGQWDGGGFRVVVSPI